MQAFLHSGLLPRLDAHIGSFMMDPKHLKGELGMQFQTYEGSCQHACKAPRGRACLFMLSQHLQLHLNRGQPQPHPAGVAKDEKFVRKIEHVLNSIPGSYQPAGTTRFAWLYLPVKRCKLLESHADPSVDSQEESRVRRWEWSIGEN